MTHHRQTASGLKLSGQGWKKGLGGALITLGGLGAAGNIGSDKIVEGILGGAILSGIGAALIVSDKKKKQSGSGIQKEIAKRIKESVKRSLKQHQIGGAITAKKVNDFIKQHQDKPIHVKDIFGTDWKKRGKQLLKEIEKVQKGGNIFKDIGNFAKKTVKKATSELKRFVEGKTKFKPSTLLDVAAGAVGLAGAASAFIPGVDLISVPAAAAASLGLKSGAHLLKTSGRGVSLSGGKMSMKHKEYIIKYPMIAQQIAKLVQQGSGYSGRGKAGRLAAALGIAGTSAAAGAMGLYQYLLNNPSMAAKIAAKGAINVGSKFLSGQGHYGSGNDLPKGVSYTKTGKIKRDRYSVYYGFYKTTKSGLSKDAFFKDGNKIKSKAKRAQGMKAIKYLQ